MKAIVRDTYGSSDVLRLEEIERPVPKNDEVLLRVRASSLNRADRYLLQGTPRLIRVVSGFLKPKKRGMGMDFSGDVEQVGGQVTDVKPGDAVYGQIEFGETWAEYACVPGKLVATKPRNMTYEEAAAVPLSAFTALQGLRDKGRVEDGQAVLINGATGAVGTYAVQIAKAFGAEVAAVCRERNIELVRSLGADHAIPYDTEDFTTCGRQFDVLFDVAGNRSLRACRRVMKRKGTYIAVGAPDEGWLGPVGPLIAKLAQAPFVSQRVVSFTAKPNRRDLQVLTDLIESGKVKSAIDRQFDLAEIPDALRYLVEQRPPSKVVISI